MLLSRPRVCGELGGMALCYKTVTRPVFFSLGKPLIDVAQIRPAVAKLKTIAAAKYPNL
jgi:hypothetical protein